MELSNLSITNLTILWGPGIIILVGIYSITRAVFQKIFSLVDKHLGELVKSQKSQSAAVEKLAFTLEKQSSKDSIEHESIMLTLKVISSRLEDVLENRFKRREQSHEEIT